MDPHPEMCITLSSADLEVIVQTVNREARNLGIPITPYTADQIAAARKFGLDAVYAGTPRNIPRPAKSAQSVLGVRWLLLS